MARTTQRISTVIATNSETADFLRADGRPPTEFLRLGRLAKFYLAAQAQLPRVLACRDLDAAALRFRRGERTSATVRHARVWLFGALAGPVVAVLTVDIDGEPRTLIPFLEDCHYDHVSIGTLSLAAYVGGLLDEQRLPLRKPAAFELSPQRHQMVFTAAAVPEDTIQRIIYRADLAYDPEHSSIQFPAELNRRPTSTAAVGAYVSVLAVQQDYIENCALLSAVQIVAAVCKVREISQAAHDGLRRARDLSAGRESLATNTRRAELARLRESTADQELQLTFGVEAACEIGLLVPALRVESFHRQLVSCTRLAENVATVSSMLARASSVLGAEEASQASLDAQKEDLRRLRYGVAAGLLSVVTIPVGIVLSFFGGSYREVDGRRSLFDWSHYYGVYLSALGLVWAAVAVFAFLFWRERRLLQRHRP
ncbi:hypothetical protein [Frankia sp. AgB32]|uniref:hypothetical protein n=1 Tax=Frankia sp. AgB32 TaxID=631119 RepID=UPI00200DB30F|nr:hypothetical protein [Frankia sp. AgB32]MCK9897503.1 hypothetical protein [Frankia sp. AgB32]